MSYGLYIGKNLTSDGHAWLAGYGDEPSSHWLEIIPKKKHNIGKKITVGVTKNADMPGRLSRIPQVSQTHKHIRVSYSYYLGVPVPITNGGLNEYGIAAYKTINDFAQQELSYILDIGGITIKTGMQLGKQINLEDLQQQYDAVFLGCGLGTVNQLNLDNENISGVIDAVEYIANLRQTTNKEELMVGKNIVVIGGGMTAIDIAVQSKLLGAEQVTIAYRRSKNWTASKL